MALGNSFSFAVGSVLLANFETILQNILLDSKHAPKLDQLSVTGLIV